jgi:hypothetical protein
MHPIQASHSQTQRRVEDACAEADRLAESAEQAELRLRDARRRRAALERELDDLRLADPRALAEAKAQAQADYRVRIRRATRPPDVMGAATAWLSEVDRLNRTASSAASRAKSIAARARDADLEIDRLELGARAAAVSAEAARQACLEARRALVRQDEATSQPAAASARGAMPAPPAHLTGPALDTLVAGERASFSALVRHLAEEAGVEESRMQLLLLELREAIVAQAFAAAAFDFPASNKFWSQFSLEEARAIAASLAVVGRGFDGRGGWREGRPAEPRELAIALSLAGRDPRTIKHRPSRAEIEELWEGTRIAAAEHIRERAPDLGLEPVMALLGTRAEGLSELWDNWGRLRRLLLDRAA